MLPVSSLKYYEYYAGGAFVLGDDEEFGIYDGVNLANRTGHIIVASNYRVGPFGFMALDQLAKEDKDGSTGNAAMQDQAAALMWVRDNIAAFGGDPEKVTIFGESAGGFSVGWHLTSQSSTGLFRGAIMESGSTDTPQFFQNISDAVAFNSLYAAAIGCNASAMPLPPDGSDPSVDPLLVCLRGKSTEHIMESLLDMLNPDWPFVSGRDATAVATATHTELRDRLADVAALRGALNSRGAMPFGSPRLPALSPLMPWGPAIDGKPTGTLAMPLALIRAGQFNKVPVILGTNKDEGTIFVPAFLLIDRNISWPPSDSDLPAIVRRAFNMYDEAAVASATDDIIMPAYPAAAYTDNFHRAAAMIKHAVFSCVARRTAQALVAAGVPTWMYRFSFNATSHWLWQVLGDAHGSELTYVFRNEWFEAFDAQDSQISDAFSAFWGNMASALDPNDGVAVPAQWPAFTAEGEEYLELQLPFTAGQHLDAKVCDAWDAFEAAVQGSTSLARTLKLSS